jgi:UDP-glucuronate 4-epimerase
MAIRKFTKLVMKNKPIPMFGDGSSIRDYTYIDDCIDCISAAVEQQMDFEIINIGSGRTITLKELIKVLGKVSGADIKVKKIEAQTGDVPVTYADISKAKKLLNYKPQFTIEEGIRRFFEWYKKEHT